MPVVESFTPSRRIDDLGDGAGVVCRPGSFSFFSFSLVWLFFPLGMDDGGGDGEVDDDGGDGDIERWRDGEESPPLFNNLQSISHMPQK